MSSEVNNLYEFGDFQFNPETNTRWRGEDLIGLSPKALELLKLLIERRGEIVSKQEIFDARPLNGEPTRRLLIILPSRLKGRRFGGRRLTKVQIRR